MCTVCNTCFEVYRCKYGMVMLTNVSRSPHVEMNCPINMRIVSQCRRCQGWSVDGVKDQLTIIGLKLLGLMKLMNHRRHISSDIAHQSASERWWSKWNHSGLSILTRMWLTFSNSKTTNLSTFAEPLGNCTTKTMRKMCHWWKQQTKTSFLNYLCASMFIHRSINYSKQSKICFRTRYRPLEHNL